MLPFFQKKVVTRMAPSPTGHLHIGTVRTALFNYLYAKHHKGSFVLRIEDTDKERSLKEYEDEIVNGLQSLGITWDSFHRQSDRTDIYTKYLEKAVSKNKAYVSEEPSKTDPEKTVEVVRLRNPNKTITFEDEVRGEISFDTTELGDFVIARAINDPLYHFTVVVDDHEMDVTHVIRGEDGISNTPRQILIQEALGFERPIYAHLPLVLAPDKSKLSKRHGAVTLEAYRSQGYINGAIINYLALLGWNPGNDQELYTLPELIHAFELSGIQKGGAVFDIEKLKWFNKEHLKTLSDDDFINYIDEAIETLKQLPQYDDDRLARLLPSIRERVHTSEEVRDAVAAGEYDFVFVTPQPSADILKWKKDDSVRDALPRLQRIAEIFSRLPEDSSVETIKNAVWDYAEEKGKGEVLWPLRVALTGLERSPDPFTVTYVIGPSEAYKRIKNACDTIMNT